VIFSGASGRSDGVGLRAGDLSGRRKAAVLATCCLAVLITGMDLTIANLAIPAIRTDLAATAAHAQSCPGALVNHVCWQLSELGESCALECGGLESVDQRLTINGASSSAVVKALDDRYRLGASYLDGLDEPCHTPWISS
jgi:hypothetical protein